MESIEIENLRSLKDTGKIPLKSINLLLGANSSGKSTFLRVFPLLKQSIEVRTRGPILWYGDYVDFGNFKTAVNKGEKEIVFIFEVITELKNTRPFVYPIFISDKNVKIKIFIRNSNENTYVQKLTISFDDQLIEIGFSSNNRVESLKVNESNYSNLCENLTFNQIGLLPHIREISKSHTKTTNIFDIPYQHGLLFYNQLFDNFKSKTRKNTSRTTLHKLLFKFKIGTKKEILSNIKENTQNLRYFLTQIKNWDTSNKDFNEFNNLLIASRTSLILDFIGDYLNNHISNFSYIAPLRATAQRYYRRQDLAVTEVDFQGQNLAMYIDNMTDSTKNKFQNWVSQHFGFYPDTKSSEGHISLRIVDSKSKDDYNIADRGFGYSQILPVITLLWSVVTDKTIGKFYRTRTKTKILAIEQPELHLHPNLQAKMTKAFIAAIRLAEQEGFKLKLIIETHSPTIVNTLGHEIAEGHFPESNASVVLFEKNSEKNCSTVKLANYNKEGYLENWPIGFFEPQN